MLRQVCAGGLAEATGWECFHEDHGAEMPLSTKHGNERCSARCAKFSTRARNSQGRRRECCVNDRGEVRRKAQSERCLRSSRPAAVAQRRASRPHGRAEYKKKKGLPRRNQSEQRKEGKEYCGAAHAAAHGSARDHATRWLRPSGPAPLCDCRAVVPPLCPVCEMVRLRALQKIL